MFVRNDQTTSIVDLPHDVLKELFRYLNAEDILNFSFTNKASHEFVNNILKNNPRFLEKLHSYRSLQNQKTMLPQLSIFNPKVTLSQNSVFLRNIPKYTSFLIIPLSLLGLLQSEQSITDVLKFFTLMIVFAALFESTRRRIILDELPQMEKEIKQAADLVKAEVKKINFSH